jgi:hypothetical protein
MEIYLDRRGTKTIRMAAQDAVDEGDTESLREEILEAFTEEQVEEIERRLDSADFYEFLTDVIDEWSGDDVDELFELIETQLAEAGIDLKTDVKNESEEEEAEDDEEPEEDDEDLDDDLDEDLSEEDVEDE